MEKREVVRRGRRVGVYTYIDPEDFEELEKIIRETGMSLSGLVRMVVKEWLRKEKETSQKTLNPRENTGLRAEREQKGKEK